MTVQKQNAEFNDLISARFPKRNEPNFAVGNILSTYLMLPELRGLWPFSSINESGNALDLSGQGRILTNTGPAARGVVGLVPYSYLTNDNFSRADETGLDITGALTFGLWKTFDSIGAGGFGVMCKSRGGGSNQFGYMLLRQTANMSFYTSSNGIALTAVGGDAVSVGPWYFIACRFTPSTEISLWVNGVKATNAVGIPASIFNNAQPLEIGRYNDGVDLYDSGSVCLAFLCAAAASDAVIRNLFQQSRAAFGV